MKRIISFLLTILMVATLVGCGTPKPNLDHLIAMRETKLRHQSITYLDPDYYIYDVTYRTSTATFSEDSYKCKGTFDVEFNEWFRLKGELTSGWRYWDSEKEWYFVGDNINDIECLLNTNIEGSWEQDKYQGRYILVKNQTKTGFDIYVEKLDSFGTWGDEWVHVERVTAFDKDLQGIVNDGRCRVKYSGINSAGKEVRVTLFTGFGGRFGIEAGAVDRTDTFINVTGYYKDYVPHLVKNP